MTGRGLSRELAPALVAAFVSLALLVTVGAQGDLIGEAGATGGVDAASAGGSNLTEDARADTTGELTDTVDDGDPLDVDDPAGSAADTGDALDDATGALEDAEGATGTDLGDAAAGALTTSDPTGKTTCRPVANDSRVERCQVPAGCQGRLWEQAACTPPVQCWLEGTGVLCLPPEDVLEAPGNDGWTVPPACTAANEDWATETCTLPASCRGFHGRTPLCSPDPTCLATAPGTYVCDRTRAPLPAPQDGVTGLAAEIEATIQRHASLFLDALDAVRTAHATDLAALEAGYRQDRADLRAEHRACLAGTATDALACNAAARAALEDLNAWTEERIEQAHAGAREQALAHRTQSCVALGAEVGVGLHLRGLDAIELPVVLPGEQVPLCASVGLGPAALGLSPG